MSCENNIISVWDLDVGKALNFILTSGPSALDLTGANVTMMLDNGIGYAMEVISSFSGTVRYTVSSRDFMRPKNLIGQLRVSFSTNVFHTSTFELVVRRSVGKDPT